MQLLFEIGVRPDSADPLQICWTHPERRPADEMSDRRLVSLDPRASRHARRRRPRQHEEARHGRRNPRKAMIRLHDLLDRPLQQKYTRLPGDLDLPCQAMNDAYPRNMKYTAPMRHKPAHT